MNTNTPNLKKAVPPSATTHDAENMYNILLKLEDEDVQSIFIYHKTISAMCNLIKPYGWHPKVYFKESTEVDLVLKFIKNKNQNMNEPPNLVFSRTINSMSAFIVQHGWNLNISTATNLNFTLNRNQNLEKHEEKNELLPKWNYNNKTLQGYCPSRCGESNTVPKVEKTNPNLTCNCQRRGGCKV